MPRTPINPVLLTLGTALSVCTSTADAQSQRSYSNTQQKTASQIPLRCSPPGAMSLDGSFFTIPLRFNLHVAEFNLNAQWDTHFLDRGAGYYAPAIGAPAGPLPTGGVVFNYNGRLIRWDPGVGITFMNNQSPNPSGASPWPDNPTDTACGDSIMIVGNDGKLYARNIAGNAAWTNWGNFGIPFEGTPGLGMDPFTGVTYAAVTEQFGRVWIIEDVCGVNGAPNWIQAGWGGPNAGFPGGDPLAFGTSVSSGLNGGKFYVTADYWTGSPTDLYETSPGGNPTLWGWFNHGHPTASVSDVGFFNGFTGFASIAVPARDAILILTTDSSGVIELALKYYDFSIGVWSPWINLGSPPTDTILADTLTSEDGANRIVVKGTSGKFWMCRNDGSGWFWDDLDTPTVP